MVRVAEVVGLVVLLSVVAVAPAAAIPPEQSLARCQRTVAEEGQLFVTRVQQVVGRCLDAAADESLRRGRPSVDAAARTCVNALGEITRNRGDLGVQPRFETVIARWCVPGQRDVTHTAADVLGASPAAGQPIDARSVGALCRGFGGDGAIDSVEEWLACVVASHWSLAATAIATEYPRALQWLGELRPAMAGGAGGTEALAALDRLATEIESAAEMPSPALPATGQTASYAPGDDGALRTGAPLAFHDNGDGTITDESTGLVWEKKADAGGLHDKDGAYTWNPGAGSIWEWLAAVNAEGGSGFAGKSDWRIPNKKELESIVDASRFNPAFPALFASACTSGCTAATCSCTASLLHYWTSTSVAAAPNDFAWGMLPSSGAVQASNRKTAFGHVRAVRGP
ncbi:DUF1566 domain-containing protein [Candidatus Binatia bacterium]|jgi:hypothetical protein|nr:DUF1566 domain-containing protein [Candidatus Binatia bacterium]